MIMSWGSRCGLQGRAGTELVSLESLVTNGRTTGEWVINISCAKHVFSPQGRAEGRAGPDDTHKRRRDWSSQP